MILGLDCSDSAIRAVVVDSSGKVLGRSESLDGSAMRAAREALAAAGMKKPATLGVAGLECRADGAAALLETLREVGPDARAVPTIACGNATALAEAWCGAGRGARHLVAFSVGTRILAGVIIDGTLLSGAHQLGSSVAWLALNPVEREDYRRLGCLEAEGAAAGIVRRLVWRVKSGDRSRVLEKAGGDFAAIRLDDVLAAARDGDGVAISVIRDTVKYLAMAVSNVAAIVDPEVIVLGGVIQSASDLLLEPLRQECARRMPPGIMAQVKIEISPLGADAAAIGAARYAMSSPAPLGTAAAVSKAGGALGVV